MKLHVFPTTPGSRAALVLCHEMDLAVDLAIVDVMKGENRQAPFVTLNPFAFLPTLEDGAFVLTQTSAILKYLADHRVSPLYPSDSRQRARVNERMDWFAQELNRDWLYSLIYPQLLPQYARPAGAVQEGTLAWGLERSKAQLDVLDRHVIGPRAFVCGDAMTIADVYGAALVTMGDLIGADFARFANVQRWLTTMRGRSSWKTVNEAFDGWAASMRGKAFVTVR
jgi:glutathione S-transferase